jgi:class 3 adenylate cyclase
MSGMTPRRAFVGGRTGDRRGGSCRTRGRDLPRGDLRGVLTRYKELIKFLNATIKVVGTEDTHLKRRLTAVLIADVAGYSRLTSLDEEGTHLRLAGYVRDPIEPQTAEN